MPIILAPTDNGAIIFEREVESVSGGNHHDIRQIGWDIGLLRAIVTPSDYRALTSKRQIVRGAGVD